MRGVFLIIMLLSSGFAMEQSMAADAKKQSGTDYTGALEYIAAKTGKKMNTDPVVLPAVIKKGLKVIPIPQIHGYPEDEQGFREIIQMAELGHAESNYILGLIYSDYRVPESERDYPKAFYYFNRTVQIYPTFADALFRLGLAYERGQGVEKNVAKALELYERAGDAGSYKAYSTLATTYVVGIDKQVPKNLEKAKFFYTKAAQLGDGMSTLIWLQWDEVVKRYYSD